MNSLAIKSFIDSTKHTFQTMCNLDVEERKMQSSQERDSTLSATISLTGNLMGTVFLSFDNKSACFVTNAMLEENFLEINDTVKYTIAEIVNIIAGGVKTTLEEEGIMTTLSLLGIISGNDYNISYPKDMSLIKIYFFIKPIEKYFTLGICVKTQV